jgi:hypothetical protein
MSPGTKTGKGSVASQLRTTGPFDFETKASDAVRVRTTDAGGLSTEKAFTITVTVTNLVIGDPDIGCPDTLYQFYDWQTKPHTHIKTIRRAWNQEETHQEIAYNRRDKTPTQFWIKRQIDGWDGGHETKGTKDWQVFTIHIDKM